MIKKRTFYLILFLALLVISLNFLIRSNVLTVKSVEVTLWRIGCAEDNQIKEAANILGQNFFLADEKSLEEKLKGEFICVKKINLSKFFPDKVKINVFGREGVAIFAHLKQEASQSAVPEEIATPSADLADYKYLVDDEGIIFAQTHEDTALPSVYLSDSNLDIGKKINLNILKILNKIKEFGINIQSALLSDNFLLLFSDKQLEIVFKLTGKIDSQIASLQLILTKAKMDNGTVSTAVEKDNMKIEFIDLRFDKPIVKLAPKK